jgi:hypothetical protein
MESERDNNKGYEAEHDRGVSDNLGATVEYLICGVIKTPELDADSVELL